MTPAQQVLQFLPIALGPLVAGITQFLKDTPVVPINSGNVLLLRGTVMVLAAGCSLILAWYSGTLGAATWSNVVQDLLNALTVYATAIAAYEHVSPAQPPKTTP